MLTIYLIILAITALTGITVFFRKNGPLYLRLLSLFLCITLCSEIVGTILKIKNIDNVPQYVFYSVFEYIFWFYTLHLIVANNRIRKFIFYFCWVYPIGALLYIFLYEGIHRFPFFSYSIGALLVTYFCLYNLVSILKSSRNNVLQQPEFWVTSASLLFHAASFPILGAFNFYIPYAPVYEFLRITLLCLNYLYYPMFIVAFLYNLKAAKLKSNVPAT